MPRRVPDELSAPVARLLEGALDVGAGGTDEQRAVLRARIIGRLGRADVDLEALA